jgi:hypothetical protein
MHEENRLVAVLISDQPLRRTAVNVIFIIDCTYSSSTGIEARMSNSVYKITSQS